MTNGLCSVKQFAERNRAAGLEPKGVRQVYHWIGDNRGGFAERCVRRAGRRLLISLEGYEQWQREMR